MPSAAVNSKSKRPARRRKRKSRTEVSSSEESSSSDSSSSEDERPVKAKRKEEDVVMREVEAAKEDSSDSSSSDESEDEDASTRIPEDEDMGEMITETLPPALTRLKDTSATDALVAAKFEEYYMRLITTEFADSLDEIRKAQDFGDGSLPMLVRQLKQGVNIFKGSEKETVVEAEKRLARA